MGAGTVSPFSTTTSPIKGQSAAHPDWTLKCQGHKRQNNWGTGPAYRSQKRQIAEPEAGESKVPLQTRLLSGPCQKEQREGWGMGKGS